MTNETKLLIVAKTQRNRKIYKMLAVTNCWQTRRSNLPKTAPNAFRGRTPQRSDRSRKSLKKPIKLAEGEGFEPPVPLRARMISSHVHSTGLCHPSGAET